jgi:sugar phosphate isomerase/epimerase
MGQPNPPLTFCSPPFGHVPLLDRLAPAAAAGFSLISVQPTDIWTLEEQGMAAAEIASRIADAGLGIGEVDCTACWMDRQARQGDGDDLALLLRSLTAERVVQTAARIGAPSVVAIDLSPDPPPLAEAAEAFARLCDLAADNGLKAHIEFLPVGAIRSLSEAWAIVQAAGRANGGLTIDAWHFSAAARPSRNWWRSPATTSTRSSSTTLRPPRRQTCGPN